MSIAPRLAPRLAHAALRLGVAASLCAGLAACAESQLASHAVKKAQRGIAQREQQAAIPKDNERRPDGALSLYKVGEPYQIDGKWYYPREDYSYRETGVASWYGDEFHGRFTANGEIFDMNAVSAAHRTLPMPSVVRVTNLENGRSMVVRVNDRGPFAKDRIVDLSHRGANLLGFAAKGTARVKVEILEAESRKMKEAALQGRRVTLAGFAPGAEQEPDAAAAAPAPAPVQGRHPGEPPPPLAAPRIAVSAVPLDAPGANGGADAEAVQLAAIPTAAGPAADGGVRAARPWARPVYVQTGAYAQFDNAVRVQTTLDGLGPATLSPISANGQRFYRVRLGPFPSPDHAQSALEQVVKRGYAGAKIVAD
jgi:rare lipoprotein A